MARRDRSLRFQPAAGVRATVPVGKKAQVQIERMAPDGRGIGFVDGKTWFVAGALLDEQVRVRVLAAHSQIVEARVEAVLQASAERQSQPCVHSGYCGGCSLQHMAPSGQLALKQQALADQLQRQAGLALEHWAAPLVGPVFGYRRTARVAVRWDARAKALAVGFRAAASQDIVALDDCPVLVPALQPIARDLPAALRRLQGAAAIGHVELFHGTAAAVLVRHLEPLSQSDLALLEDFCGRHQAQLWLQGDGDARPYVPGDALGYHLARWQLTLGCQPNDFVQVNAVVNEAMIGQALDWLEPSGGQRMLDLFCGLGNFSLPLALHYGQVVGVEGVDAMVARARDNARRAALDNLHFFRADLSAPVLDQPWAGMGHDALLLDPPRSGAQQALRGLAGLRIPKVLYVSCNPATLVRDAGLLAEQGYRLRRAGMLDMFPQTAHAEAMLLFEM